MDIRLVVTLLLTMATGVSQAATKPSIAFFYADNPPYAQLHAFNVTVVQPDYADIYPMSYNNATSQLFAYASIGEVNTASSYYSRIPSQWMIGQNTAWGTQIIDQSAAGWPTFYADNVIAPLYQKGYRGFFLDTLDSYYMVATTQQAIAAQQAGLIAVIQEIKNRWPDVKLIFNRGFEILPTVHSAAWVVAAESLYQGWDASKNQYVTVSSADRTWLTNQLNQVQTNYNIPALSIDYVPPNKTLLARQTAAKIVAAGFIPYVADAALDNVGVGAIAGGSLP